MIAPSPTFQSNGAARLVAAALFVLAAIAVTASLFAAWRFAPRSILPGRDSGHADNRHNGEQYPPEVIRACIANALTPFEYVNSDKIAFLCRLADNRYGVQIMDAASRREITTFYGTLSRMKNILARDRYTPVVPLP